MTGGQSADGRPCRLARYVSPRSRVLRFEDAPSDTQRMLAAAANFPANGSNFNQQVRSDADGIKLPGRGDRQPSIVLREPADGACSETLFGQACPRFDRDQRLGSRAAENSFDARNTFQTVFTMYAAERRINGEIDDRWLGTSRQSSTVRRVAPATSAADGRFRARSRRKTGWF